MAFSVPNSLVVTLERVLGNETIGKVHCFVDGFILILNKFMMCSDIESCWMLEYLDFLAVTCNVLV